MKFLAKNAQWEHTTFYKSIDVSPSTSLSNLISSFVGSFFHQNTTESDRDFDRLNLRCWRARSMQWLGIIVSDEYKQVLRAATQNPALAVHYLQMIFSSNNTCWIVVHSYPLSVKLSSVEEERNSKVEAINISHI